MGKVKDEDLLFKALADRSRRDLLDRLRKKNGQSLGELCEGHEMSRQAVSKHLAILEAANLVTSVCFAGPDSRDLFIVSADNKDDPDLCGCVFRTTVDVRGAPVGAAAI